MKIKYFLTLFFLIFCNCFTLSINPATLKAANNNFQFKDSLSIDYDVVFQYNFDNREFDYSEGRYTNSMTIHAARLTPSIGFSAFQKNNLSHKVLLGIDVLKNMGEKPLNGSPGVGEEEKNPALNNWRLFKEITCFYHFRAPLAKWKVEAVAGIFPRYYSEAPYGREMISDSLYFYDNNIEGLLLKFRSPKSYHEFSCDWLGMYGDYRKEAFIVSTYSESFLKPYLKLGIKSRMQHSACSEKVKEVIDNLLFIPFVEFDLSEFTFLKRLNFSLQWHQGLQNFRGLKNGLIFPHGFQLVSDIMKWNVGINNTLFFGTNMLPYYNTKDALGNKYGVDLYHQSPFYRVRAFEGAEPADYNWREAAFYDRLELYYRPRICSFADFNLSFIFFFNGKFSGWQQNISVVFYLSKVRNR